MHYKFTYSKWYCARQGVSELARRIKSTLNRLWNSQSIFWFSQWSIPFLEWRLGWYGFLPLAGLIYWAVFFWKELKIDSLCFFFPMFIFLKMIYSQNDDTSILEVLETIFFSLPKHGGQTFNHIRRLSGKFEVILIDLFFPFKLQSLKKILRADPHWSAYLLDNNKISTFCPEEDVLWSDFYLLIEPFKKKSS